MTLEHRWAALLLVVVSTLLPASDARQLQRLWRCARPVLLALDDGRPARLCCLPRARVALRELLTDSAVRRCPAPTLAREVFAGQRVRLDRGCHMTTSPLGGATTLASGLRIDVNSASASALRALPRVGEVIARRIVARRAVCGPFRSLDELRAVRGIGPATLRRLRELVRFGAPPARSARSRPPSPTDASARCR